MFALRKSPVPLGKPLTRTQLEDARRLAAALETAKERDPTLSQEKIAHLCGWRSQSVVSQYATGRIALNLSALLKFAAVLDLDPQDISPALARALRGGGMMRQAGTPTYGVRATGATGVPVVTWEEAARGAIAPPGPGQDAREWLLCPVAHSRRTFALRVRGISMQAPGRPSFGEGDLVYVDPEREAKHLSCVVVHRAGAAEVVFRQLVIEGEKRYLRALNPAWPEPMTELGPEDEIVGTAIFRGEVV